MLIANKKTTIHEVIHIMENHFDCSVGKLFNCEREVGILVDEMRYAWGG